MKPSLLSSGFTALALALLLGCTAVPTSTASAKIKIHYQAYAQAELISPEGTRVLIDVVNPAALTNPATDKDILLTTHTHSDHINNDFLKSFTGQQLFVKIGSLQAPGVNIHGIAAAHNSGDTLIPENGTDYIFLIEMGGLRIAHFGDIGQDSLTAEQLAVLGRVDIAFMQFENSYSAMDTINKKGFNLMDQVKPHLILPTHVGEAAVKMLGERWPTLYSEKLFVAIGPSDLASDTRVLFLGNTAKELAEMTNAVKIDW